MYFCPKCSFSLDIIKNVQNPFVTELNNVDDFLDLKESNNIEGIVKVNFSKKELLSNSKFKKMDKDSSKILSDLYDNFKLDQSKNAFFFCNNCNYHTILNPGTVIFKTTLNEDLIDDNSLVDSRVLDSTLPRTKDFICPNSNCKVIGKEKEAIFFRPFSNSYNLKYVCCNCKTSWDP